MSLYSKDKAKLSSSFKDDLSSFKYIDGRLFIVDQRLLPNKEDYIEISDINAGYNAIKSLAVRGAPAIGVASAYIMVVAMKGFVSTTLEIFKAKFSEFAEHLISSRPTAVNLAYAVNRLKKASDIYSGDNVKELFGIIADEAVQIEKEDIEISEKIGEFGAEIIKDGCSVLTHCNAGLLATSKLGTALAPIYVAKKQGKRIKVYADETRPLFQGARLTAYELMKNEVDTTVLSDNMASSLMQKGAVDMVIVGCDRVAKNGDTANKIGTLSVAINAKYFGIPFFVALPSSTYDRTIPTGKYIPIEERNSDEVRLINGIEITPKNIKIFNPAFDVTPYSLVTAFITNKGIIYPPFEEGLTVL